MTLPYLPIYDSLNSSFLAAVLPGVLDDLTNQNRQSQNLSPLVVSPTLNNVAEMKVKDMAKFGYFAHTSPDGKEPWYWFNLAGYKYEYAGENLAVDFNDSTDVALAWMNSPTHKANILKNSYTEVGTAVATGTYQGNSTIFVAQEFGRPAISNVVTKVAEAAPIAVSPVGKQTNEPIAVQISAPVVLGIATNIPAATVQEQSLPQSTAINRLLTSPRHVLNIILIVIGSLVLVALILKLFIRMDKRHPILITNGLAVIVIILGIFTINNFITKIKSTNMTSFAGFTADVFDSDINR